MTRVVKIGGRVQSDPRLAGVLAAAHRGAPGGLVIVHGGGDDVTALQRRLGQEPTFVGGRRVTSADELEIVRMVLSGSANKRLVAALISAGVKAAGVSGEDGGMLQARVAAGAPLGRVGEHVAADATLVRDLLAKGWLPVVSPVARDADSPAGDALNVNGDDAAAALAAALAADELVFVADVPGVVVREAVASSLVSDEAAGLIRNGVAAGGMAAKLEAGFSALAKGVKRVRIAHLDALDDPAQGTSLLPSLTAAPWRR